MQGFGNVGSWTARLLYEQGGIVKAIGDETGAVKSDAGLDVFALQKHVAAVGGIKGFTGGDAIESSAVLSEDCDVLIPAALGGVLTRYVSKSTYSFKIATEVVMFLKERHFFQQTLPPNLH